MAVSARFRFQPINDLGRGPNDPEWATAETYEPVGEVVAVET